MAASRDAVQPAAARRSATATALERSSSAFGKHGRRVDAEIDSIRCIGLNEVARPGNLVGVEVAATAPGLRILAEWPRAGR